MLLQQLKLNNIRSYIEETINFPEGSTLLSGDIGSGKSTILLSIEFALFGTAQPNLPAELLLRKGASLGSVELRLKLKDKEITIKRNLKKEKNIIKQLPGYLIINDIKKELTPVELKSEMISMLGYPEDIISKNKNYIYRYTVYTPQEEMKFILQEDCETRLDVLRKIFNFDKYKTIRENLQKYLRKTRTKIAILKTKTEPLEEHKQQLRELNQEKEILEMSMIKEKPKLSKIKEDIDKEKKEIEQLEQQQKEFIELQQNYKTTIRIMEEKREQNGHFRDKLERLKLEIIQLSTPEDMTIEQVRLELNKIEEQKNIFFTRKTTIQEKINHLQNLIENSQEEIKSVIEETLKIEEKENLKETLINEINQKDTLLKKKKELEDLFEKTLELIVKNQTILSQSQDTYNKIFSLDNCPTCLQEVSKDHKEKIVNQERQKCDKAEHILFELNKKRSEIFSGRETTLKKIEQLFSKENLLTRTTLELAQLKEKKELIGKRKEQLKLWASENNLLVQQLQELTNDWDIEKINLRIMEMQSLVDAISKKNFIEKNLQEVSNQLKENLKNISIFQSKITGLEKDISDKEDLSSKINIKKQKISEYTNLEKDTAVKVAQLQTQIDGINKQEETVKKIISKLNEERDKLIRLRELYSWLEGHFLKLTYTIEKQVMINIHHHFNLIFQEWFSILIDDENIYSRIDDTFTPIIEQNGYDISFSNLSGGEKTSAALAYRLALNKVINDIISGINTKNLLILDEPTDGFSSEQLDKVRDVLERLNLQQTIIVSHESKIESFVDNIVRVSKEGHVSVVV
ncbi:MAG: SMC family ATPase [Nanoarchaeota archaeon]|nr:SMC family ATPase [Nanoarchaeota archaeon]MBU1632220.1 SMC family ATPase [Nanoarchaeota archaeon]MBU1875518.1 SMC family ATPase [Nanoarchaeota archaeon]